MSIEVSLDADPRLADSPTLRQTRLSDFFPKNYCAPENFFLP